MARSFAAFREYAGLTPKHLEVRSEFQSVVLARGAFRHLEVSGPKGPFSWTPGASSVASFPFADVNFNDVYDPSETLQGTAVSLDVDGAMTGVPNGTSIDAWKFTIGNFSTNPRDATTNMVGGAPFLASFRFPDAPTAISVQIACRLFAFPLTLYVFTAKQVGDACQLFPYTKGSGASFTLFSPLVAVVGDPQATCFRYQGVSLSDELMARDLAPFLEANHSDEPRWQRIADLLNAEHTHTPEHQA